MMVLNNQNYFDMFNFYLSEFRDLSLYIFDTKFILIIITGIVFPLFVEWIKNSYSSNVFSKTKRLESLHKLFEQLNNTTIYFAGSTDSNNQVQNHIKDLHFHVHIVLANWHNNNYRRFGRDINLRPISLSEPLYKMADFRKYINDMNLKNKQRNLIEKLCYFNDFPVDSKKPKIKSRIQFHIINEPVIDHMEGISKTPQYRDFTYYDIPIESC